MSDKHQDFHFKQVPKDDKQRMSKFVVVHGMTFNEFITKIKHQDRSWVKKKNQ